MAWEGRITQKAVTFDPDGRVLLGRVAHPDDDRYETDTHWEPPGGTYEPGETLPGGLAREMREETGLDVRVGPPVAAVYGGWVDDETGDPMVTLVYRCETDERDVRLNDEFDGYEWVFPQTAIDRLAGAFGERMARGVRRAAAMNGASDPGVSETEPADWGADPPFAARRDPYDGTELTSEEVLETLAEIERSETKTPERTDSDA